jgi:peptide/nickel transport system substrate-binding protein
VVSILVIIGIISGCSSVTTSTTTAPTLPVATSASATTTATSAPVPTTTSPVSTTTTTATIAEKDKYGGIWKMAQGVAPSSPIGYVPESANDSMSAASPCLESMFRVQKDGKIVPRLATSWDIDAKAATMTFHLREGVKFSDGSDFNAQNVKWCWDLEVAAKRTPNINSIDVVDNYTVRVNFKTFQNTDVTGFDGGYYGIFSKASFDKNGIEYTRTHPVGTGPFLLKEYVRDSKLTYIRNPNYWNPGVPYLDGFEVNIIKEETVRKMAFEMGDITMLNATAVITPDLLKKNYVYSSDAGGTYGLVPDSANADSPFANIKVRQAISYAIDRQAIAAGIGANLLTPAYQIYPTNSICAQPEGSYLKTEYNVAKAKQLLAEAGYAGGFKTSIHTFVQAVNRDYVTAIAKMLGDAGIQCEADFPEAGKYQEYRVKGWNNSLLAHGFMNLTSNPNAIATWYLPQSNITFPSVKRPANFYDLLNASLASPTVDPVKVQAAYKTLADDFTFICYAEDRANVFYAKGAHDEGGKLFSLSFFIPELAWLEPAARK